MPKVSVIVPIYGVEPYLSQCVESLRVQTLQSLEILLVDDGSPDNCGLIADDFARQDSRIRVLHQENAGLGPARNAGLAMARGEYVAFVDGDDWVEPTMYEELYRAAKTTGADIAVSGHRDMARGRELAKKPHPLAGQILSSGALFRARQALYGPAAGEAALPGSVCMSLYRREWVECRNLRFRKLLSEDVFFNLDAYGCAGRVVFTGGTGYCYRKEGQSSITHSFSPEKQTQYREFLTALWKQAEGEQCTLRVKGTALGIARMYAGQVAAAPLPLAEKRKLLRKFWDDPEICRYWADYPVEMLPPGQRIFHRFLQERHYLAALGCCRLRQWLKERRIAP